MFKYLIGDYNMSAFNSGIESDGNPTAAYE